MNLSFSITLLTVLIVKFVLVEAGVMIVSSSFSEPRPVLALLPLLLEGLSLLLHVPFGFDFSPGLPGLEGVLLEAWGCGAWGWASLVGGTGAGAASPACCCAAPATVGAPTERLLARGWLAPRLGCMLPLDGPLLLL